MELDTAYLQQVREQYPYCANLPKPVTDSSESSAESIARDVSSSISDVFTSDAFKVIGLIVTICLLALLVYLILKHVKFRSDDDAEPAGMGSDTIYGHEWDKEIHDFMAAGNYGEVVVLCYLRWLNQMNDSHVVAFHRSKTPNMFLDEVRQYAARVDTAGTSLVEKTETLTHHYLRIRYGHRSADVSLAEKILAL